MATVAEMLGVDVEDEQEGEGEYQGGVDWERVWNGEPRTAAESMAWKDALVGHLQGTDRSIAELNRGVRVMHPDGRYMTQAETHDWRSELIHEKERTLLRMRWLKHWWQGSKQRAEDRRQWEVSDRAKRRAQVTYDEAMGAIKRIGLMEELYLAVETYLNDPEDQLAWRALNDAFDDFDRSWPAHEGGHE